ncbi:Uu.00g055700.m01.CDS01 [Anthostomella pinea]|uniref:Uu.00g055700.m01.CDS01 n=1 Tax=Anthostomella pinea TaxID=933095 RepID=A0AAI8VXS0_9PEZI|nr:Uu.00g055700.m01.CDS01 [Anthostomella pinea]
MSAVKFEYPTYKLFEPHYHPQRPIIVDADALESPETVTLRYEEEAAARANGGDLRGDSPPGLLSMSAYPKPQPPQMHAFESSRSYPDSQYQYSAQQFAAQQSENAAAQLNQMAFAANNSASQYMTSVVPTLLSYQPTSGVFGTKILIKISAPYDLIAVTSHFFLAFGAHKGPAHAIRDAGDASGLGYVVSGDAPQLEDTRNPSGSVPLSLLIESSDGQTLATIDVGTFTYHDPQVGAAEGPHEGVTRKESKSPEQRPSPPKPEPDQLTDAATNSYGYALASHQTVASSYDAGYNSNNSMIGPYHRSSYAADYPRPPLLKAPTWSPYGSSMTPRSPTAIHHATITRPSITTLPMPTSSAPQLIRTSTIQTSGSSSAAQMNPYAMYSAKANLKINGDLETMASNWTQEEWENRRRIVMFNKKQQGSTLSTSFKPVTVSERPPNSICISCIYWAEKNECYVTSVDTISLLEQLVASPARFTVEEKNRIRRNLEGFRPLTVSKAKADSEEFFKIIMAFPNPKPRNIEKDVKVFPWKVLATALKKIISKYSASPSSQLPSGGPTMLTPVSSTSPGLYAMPHTPTVSDGGYSHHDSHTMASPRSLSGAPPSWAAYAGRTLSPSLKTHSPQAGIRIPSIPSYGQADARQHSTHHYGMAPHSQRWDSAVANGYGDASASPAYTSHHHQHQSHVYGTGAYGDAGHRD